MEKSCTGCIARKNCINEAQQMPLIKSSTMNVKEIRIRVYYKKNIETGLDRVQGFDMILIF